MNVNAHGDMVRRIRSLNLTSAEACISQYISETSTWRRLFALKPEQCARLEISSRQAALLLWASKVMVDADWDHKPKIAARFKSAATGSHAGMCATTTSTSMIFGPTSTTDTSAAPPGFSESLLLDGAGLEQLATDVIVRLSPPTRSA